MLESTSKFRVHQIIYRDDRRGFALASGYWDGDEAKLQIACRWFEEGGIGYPQTFGKPQWLLFPDNISVGVTDILNPKDSELVVRFPRTPSDADKKQT